MQMELIRGLVASKNPTKRSFSTFYIIDLAKTVMKMEESEMKNIFL